MSIKAKLDKAKGDAYLGRTRRLEGTLTKEQRTGRKHVVEDDFLDNPRRSSKKIY